MKHFIFLVFALVLISCAKPSTQIDPLMCDLTEHCSAVPCACPLVEHAACYPLCINKQCECVEFDIRETIQQVCEEAEVDYKYFPNLCVDTCDLARNPDLECPEAETFGCDCGPDMCWNGVNCEPN